MSGFLACPLRIAPSDCPPSDCPEVVGHLLRAGVEFYHVDYVARRKSFYSSDGSAVVVTSIDYEGLPGVALDFDSAAVKAAILGSQRHGQLYRDFYGTGYRRRGHVANRERHSKCVGQAIVASDHGWSVNITFAIRDMTPSDCPVRLPSPPRNTQKKLSLSKGFLL